MTSYDLASVTIRPKHHKRSGHKEVDEAPGRDQCCYSDENKSVARTSWEQKDPSPLFVFFPFLVRLAVEIGYVT